VAAGDGAHAALVAEVDRSLDDDAAGEDCLDPGRDLPVALDALLLVVNGDGGARIGRDGQLLLDQRLAAAEEEGDRDGAGSGFGLRMVRYSSKPGPV
jgi:hypothetical protein